MRYTTFQLAGQTFGIDVREVREVIRSQPVTPVPRAAETVAGLINLRGQIVTAFDLGRRLGLATPRREEHPMKVVVTTPAGPVALLVDRIGDVVEVGERRLEPPPPTLPELVRDVIVGAYPLEGELLLVLDVRATLASAETVA